MTRILFIQREATEKFGVMTLSAVLKKAGYEVGMFVELLEREPLEVFLKRFKPEFVAFSITNIERTWALKTAAKIKRKSKVYCLFGGAEPTYHPELIEEKVVDFVCRGEGEDGLLELLKRLSEGKSLRGVKNFWVKEKGKIIKNELRNLKKDLDSLPLPDRELYYKYSLMRNLSAKKFLCSRGCPYGCTYCSNHSYRQLFSGKGHFLRFRSPESLIEEIKMVKTKYGLKTVYFSDETFTLNHPWLYRLLELYRKEIKLPFSCLARANELDEETIKMLKKSGCFYLSFGLETGSERIRSEVLKRNMKDEELLKVGRLLKKYQIPFLTHEMFVLPTETLEDAFKTVAMNIKMGTDSVWGTIFQPFDNTEIYKFCLKENLISSRTKVGSTHGTSVIKNPDKKQIENLRKIDWLTIKFPWLFPLTKRLVFLPDNPFFVLSLRLSEIYSVRRRWRLGYWEMVKLAFGTGDILG